MGARPLVLVSGWDPLGAGGHESYVRAHALAAATLGFEPHVVCFSASLRRRTLRTEFGTVHRVPAPAHPRVLQSAPLAREVARLLDGAPGPHVVHGFAFWARPAVAASRALARRGVRAVAVASAYATRLHEVTAMQNGLDRHGHLTRLRYRTWLRWVRSVDHPREGRGYAQARVVLVNYESVRRILEDAYGPGLDIRRIPYAAPDSFQVAGSPAKRGAPPAGPPLILAASRHDPRKGIDVLLLALSRLAQEGVEFRASLVGPGRLLEAHRRLSARLGIAERVEIPGRVEDVRPYNEAADVFVLPSLSEGSGSVSVLEAMRAGSAVVASGCDGLSEDLADGVDALLVPPGDVAALAGALRALLKSPNRRAELGANARRTHEERFSAKRFAEALARVYGELGVSGAS